MASSSNNAGPMCLHMEDIVRRMHEMPAADNGACLSTSPAVLGLLSSRQHIHIYSVRLSIDELLHLGSLIHSYYRRPSNNASRGPGAVIIVNDVADAFSKVTALAAHVTNERLANTSNAIYCFSRIAIVRGPKLPNSCANAAEYNNSLGAAASALRKTLEHLSQVFSTSRAIWHSHQDPSLLLHIINTSPNGSPPIDAVSVFSALLFTSSSSSSNGTKTPGAITLADPRAGYGLPNIWPLLMTAATRAHGGQGIPVVFYSNCSMRVHLHAYSTQNLAGTADLFPVLLPEAVWKPVFGQVMDQLLVAAFRLLAGGDLTAASPKRIGKTVVDEVKRRLNAQLAKGWAKLCIDPRSYGEAEIMRTVKGALPAGTATPNTPLPTLEALKTTLRNPTPMCPATALSRPAPGPHSASSSSLWAIRASIAPRSGSGTPASSVALTITSRGPTHVLCTPPSASRSASNTTTTSGDDHRHPRAVQQDVGSRWAGYVNYINHRTTAAANSSGFRAMGNGFGISVQTARIWMAVVPGVFAGALEQWGRTVVGRMLPAGEQQAAARRLEEEVKAVLKEARRGKVTEMCRGVLGG